MTSRIPRRRDSERPAAWTLGSASSPYALERLAAAEAVVRDQLPCAGLACLEAVATCMQHDQVFPSAIKRSFLARSKAVAEGRVASWDEAFGLPHPGRHLEDEREAIALVEPVHAALQAMRTADPSCPISRVTFEAVGEQLAKQLGRELSGSKVERIYKRAKEVGYPDVAKAIPHVPKARRGTRSK